jgi:poly-beta-1,6-N-acetyl-D-glucosamine synthase
MHNSTKYVIITPVRNEAKYVENTIASVVTQTVLPTKWVIVDDGSTDGTGEILEQYAVQHAWIKVVHRANRGHRASGGGVIEAFYDGYAALGDTGWEFIVKLDGDLSFPPDYFERCLARFAAEPRLGIGGGMVCFDDQGQLREESVGDPPFHVRGATKIYRRACWDKIGPLVKAPGWDTIDEVKANLHGWTTRTFRDLKIAQHKATGTADGSWRNWFKNGRANYITGYHPVFMLAKCFKRALRRPLFIQAIALWAGFSSGYFMQIPQVKDRDTVRYLRQQQIRRMLLRPSIYG